MYSSVVRRVWSTDMLLLQAQGSWLPGRNEVFACTLLKKQSKMTQWYPVVREYDAGLFTKAYTWLIH